MKSAVKVVIAALATIASALLVAAPTSAASASCGVRQVSQPFERWLDRAHYFLLPGGDFESSTGWTLNGAHVVSGNEPFYVNSATDSRSLRIPAGSSARSLPTCVDSGEPTLRFFARNTGSVLSTLVVQARVRTTVLGVTTQTTLPLGVVLGTTQTWQPSLPVVFALSLNQLLGGMTTVDFVFTSAGLGGDWRIDDVYVDPFKDRGQS